LACILWKKNIACEKIKLCCTSLPLEKWTQAYDGGKRYGHVTTNLAECINFVFKGARSLPISALVKATFEKTKTWFLERAFKTDTMLRAGHHYPEDITTLFRKKSTRFDYVFCGKV